MGRTKIMELNELGQSAWLDYISRSLIEAGKFKELIGLGLRGVTSNPTIFEKAIGSGYDYDPAIQKLCAEKKTAFEIYDDITIKDIQDATDIFMPVYKETSGLDGYVSLEINPKLAYDTKATIKEGNRLHKKVDRPNLMLKVPSTKDGFEAVEELTASGINVNITLIFSLAQYVKTADAYLNGVKRFIESGGDASRVRSVASVFVSRIDSSIDKLLDGKNAGLKGKAAVANSSLIYGRFTEIFSSTKFRELESKGANLQRVLWGSTSTKSPAYSDIKYVTELMGKNTVNTLPENTFNAFLDHGAVKEVLMSDTSEAEKVIADLKEIGIDVNDVCARLLKDGVAAFEKSFDSLLETITEKSKKLCAK